MTILYEDNHILVVVKPCNIPVQADDSGDADMLSLLKDYIKTKYNKPGAVYLGLVHRLDRPVGGVMVFARTSKAAERLGGQFKGRATAKKYAALVEGAPAPHAELFDHLLRDEGTGTSRVVTQDTPGAQGASLNYRKIASMGGLTLLDIALHTGRHHQIRVQLSSHGAPIWGDQRYNRSAKPGQQIALWAYSLCFNHPTLNTRLTFTAPPEGPAWQPFSRELAALTQAFRIVYEDGDILIVDKPQGIPTAIADGGEDTLEHRVQTLCPTARPAHRLDVQTSGLVLFAKHDAALNALTDAIAARQFKKLYLCIVRGTPSPGEALLTAYAIKDERRARLSVYDTKVAESREIVTGYRVLASQGGMSELEVDLVTGRTHQIRAHMAHMGHPILGDDKYGDRGFNHAHRAYLPRLCAVRLELCFPENSPLAHLSGLNFEIEPPFSLDDIE
jgi:23S rRNA pseudouridine1911/1915/1917 synthase